jgi:hypothetical protein
MRCSVRLVWVRVMLVSDDPAVTLFPQSDGKAKAGCRVFFKLVPGAAPQQCGCKSDLVARRDIQPLDRENAAVLEVLEERTPAIPVGLNSTEFVRGWTSNIRRSVV